MPDTALLVALLFIVGLIGVVVPVIPGLVLVWAGALVWALGRADTAGWVGLGIVTAILVVGTIVKYLLPGRQLRASGVGWQTLGVGAVLGVVGFFVVPVIGLPLGFVLGVYLAEYARLHDSARAWTSTRAALAAVGWSMLLELATGLIMIAVVVAVAALA